jgi:hypothetical protein
MNVSSAGYAGGNLPAEDCRKKICYDEPNRPGHLPNTAGNLRSFIDIV